MRRTAEEARAKPSLPSGNQIGSSKLAGVHTTVLHGDPSKEPLLHYLVVRARAYFDSGTLASRRSHGRRVVRELDFGYRGAFDEKALKKLPPGSVYTEPAGVNHFARTDDLPSVVQISGLGPTDTTYVDAANDPTKSKLKSLDQRGVRLRCVRRGIPRLGDSRGSDL